jgi:hypothetical protein
MGSKIRKDGDTPWVTFKCIFVNKSNNVEVGDFADGGLNEEEEEIENTTGRCLLRKKRQKWQQEKKQMETMEKL